MPSLTTPVLRRAVRCCFFKKKGKDHMETQQTTSEMFERADVSFVFVVRFLPFFFSGVHFEIFTVWKSGVQHQKV